jgi:hypothetical protein
MPRKRQHKESRHGVIYVAQDVEDGPGPCKIGAASIDKHGNFRVAGLQSNNWRQVQLSFEAETADCRQLERLLHECFAARRIRGEWFRVRPEEVKVAISTPKPLIDRGLLRDTKPRRYQEAYQGGTGEPASRERGAESAHRGTRSGPRGA